MDEPWDQCSTVANGSSSLVVQASSGGAASAVRIDRNRLFIDTAKVKANLTFEPQVSMTQPLARVLERIAPLAKFPMRWYVHGARVRYAGTFSVNNETFEGVWDGYADRNYGVWQQRPDRPGIAGWIWVSALALQCASPKCGSDSLSLVVGGTLMGKLTFAFLNDAAGRFRGITWISNAVDRAHNKSHINLGVRYHSVLRRASVSISFRRENAVNRPNNPLVAVCTAVHVRVALSSVLGRSAELYETSTAKMEVDTSTYY